jgi:hypothetical protein
VTETDDRGEFVLEGLEAGTHKVDALPGDFMKRFATRPRDFDDGGFDVSKMMATRCSGRPATAWWCAMAKSPR